MQERISPARRLEGAVSLPGDKSISHRYAMLSAIAEGATRIQNYSTGADCHSTLGTVRALGISVDIQGTDVTVHGNGLFGLKEPAAMLDAGNSGSTIRILSGILAAQPFVSRIGGDESLSRRPMDRIIKPLTEMGAKIQARDGRFPPLEISGAALRPLDYTLPVPSAQVKTCVLLAGVHADGVTVVREPIRSRDHTEIALREFGADITVENRVISITGKTPLKALELAVPGDLSSAAFFLAAALMLPGSDLIIRNVGLNPTRSALIDFLVGIGANIRILGVTQKAGELVGDLKVQGSPVRGGVIEKSMTAALIDEIPVLAVLGAKSEEGLVVRDASELRIKETDRIATIADNLNRMGVTVETAPDGFRVPGRQRFQPAVLDSFGDHRIAMAFAVAAMAAEGECVIDGAEAACVSFPEFFDTLRRLAS